MSTEAQLRYVIVGAGTISRNHLAALGQLGSQVKVEALADINEAAAAERARTFNVPQTFTDYRKMIAEVRPDVVVVCVPPMLHAPVVIAALEGGCHVYCEKPLAATTALADDLIALAKRKGLILTANHQRRTTPRYQLLRQMLAEGRIGHIHRASLYCSFRFRPSAYYAADPKGRGQWAGACGGVLLNMCIHEIDILTWAFRVPTQVSGFCRTHKPEIEVEDDAYAVFRYGDDAMGMVHASLIDIPGRNFFEFVGDRGALEVSDEAFKLTTLEMPIEEFNRTWKKPQGKPASHTETIEVPPLPAGESEFTLMHRNFQEVVRGRLAPSQLIVPPEQAGTALEICHAIYLSNARGGQAVELPLDRQAYDDWFYPQAGVKPNLEPAAR